MIRTIADFAPDDAESGVGLVLQDEDGRYLFCLAGNRHRCPHGEMFYAGIGGHREDGENWLTCAYREANEEVKTGIDILPVQATWYVPKQSPIQQVEISDRPRPFMLYEMIHPETAPRPGQVYHIVIYKARLHEKPKDLSPDEMRGIIALTKEQVIQGVERKPRLAELLQEGASLIFSAESIDHELRLYPLGTAKALAHLLSQVREA